jgi:dihydroorotase
MSAARRFALVNAQVMLATGVVRGGLICENGKIVACGADVAGGNIDSGIEQRDCKGLLLLPGCIDMRVFTGEPGAEYRETIATASQAAAAGGITTMVVMPNTTPVIDDPAIVDYVLRLARDTADVRALPMASITKGMRGEFISEFGLLKEAGAVAVTDGTKAVADAGIFRRALLYARDFDLPVVQHVEEPSLATGAMNAGEAAARLGLSGSHAMSEVIMLERDLRLVELTGARYHASQISCSASIEVIRRAKERGLPVTCGVSIHHLTLNETDIGAYRTFFKLSPPLRSEADRTALVAAVGDGTIDVIVSSHDPQSADTKRLPFGEAAFGAVGLDTLLSAALSLHHNDSVLLSRLCDAMSASPARILGLETGTLRVGSPADFALVDPHCSWKVEPSALRSRSKNTPYEHRTLEGKAIETYVAGKRVYAYALPARG